MAGPLLEFPGFITEFNAPICISETASDVGPAGNERQRSLMFGSCSVYSSLKETYTIGWHSPPPEDLRFCCLFSRFVPRKFLGNSGVEIRLYRAVHLENERLR